MKVYIKCKHCSFPTGRSHVDIVHIGDRKRQIDLVDLNGTLLKKAVNLQPASGSALGSGQPAQKKLKPTMPEETLSWTHLENDPIEEHE